MLYCFGCILAENTRQKSEKTREGEKEKWLPQSHEKGGDEDQAATVFQQANQEGKAMAGKYPMEIAELYKEQLIRSDPMIFSDLEEENA